MDLRQYEQSKFEIAAILRSASACIGEPAPAVRERLQSLFARLAEDRFDLVVVGRFNRGKTSLMNAILATDRLPTGIVPLTSVITTVAYGSKERVALKFLNSMLDSEIAIEELPQYVTEQGNPGNVRRIKAAEIQLPVEILRRGFHFVDTPGLGSVIAENTLTTEAFLPEADAFILVTSYESPLSEEEFRFFQAASSSGTRVFVVLNKHDAVTAEQRDTIQRFVREQLNGRFGGTSLQLFSLSSTDGLAAKLTRDQPRLLASGIPELEKQLISFLLAEKRAEFLVQMGKRVREFLQGLPRSEETAKLMSQLGALSRKFGGGERDSLTDARVAPAAAFSDLHHLKTCEICSSIADRLWNFLCKYQYDIIADGAEQQRFADRGGLCPFHAWQLQSVASPYGLCAAYPPLLDRIAAKLRDLVPGAHSNDISSRLESLIPDAQECALCIACSSAEQEAIAITARRLRHDTAHAPNALSAICLPHFAKLLSAVQDGKLVRALLERHAAILERIAEDMKRYAIKHDGVRRYLASKEETTASERALLLVTGQRQVNFQPRPTHTPRAGDTELAKRGTG
jgi:small GTP-binding protein